jgi:hypothetical protein
MSIVDSFAQSFFPALFKYCALPLGFGVLLAMLDVLLVRSGIVGGRRDRTEHG